MFEKDYWEATMTFENGSVEVKTYRKQPLWFLELRLWVWEKWNRFGVWAGIPRFSFDENPEHGLWR